MSQCEKTVRINDGLTLIQNTKGLTFGTDAYLLAAFVKGGAGSVCVDLGSGTGIIPLLCTANGKFRKTYAVEIQEEFASIIARNAEQNGFSDSIIPVCRDLRALHPRDFGGEVDVVVSNPPYMKADSGKRNTHDEKFIARHEVHGGIDDFCACAGRILKHGGKLYTVWRPDRLCDLICALRNNRLEPKVIIFVHATPDSQPSSVLVQSTKGSAAGNVLLRPLFLHDDREHAAKNILSDDAAAIYASCSFESFK